MLLLEPYREFLSGLPAGTVTGSIMQQLEDVFLCDTAASAYSSSSSSSSNKKAAKGSASQILCVSVMSQRLLVPSPQGTSMSGKTSGGLMDVESTDLADQEEEKEGDRIKDHLRLLTMLLPNGRKVSVLYASHSSSFITCDVFLVDKRHYEQSLKQPWLVKGGQVRKAFASNPDEMQEEGGGGSPAVWCEGMIYHVASSAASPYLSVSVVWLSQGPGTNEWLYEEIQTDNKVSPWELEASTHVRSLAIALLRSNKLPRSMTVGALSPETVLDYVKGLDFASIFAVQLSKNAEFCEMFEDEADQLDLRVLTKLCAQGRYSDADTHSNNSSSSSSAAASGASGKKGTPRESSLGIMTLFRDLDRMVANGKAFNECNRGLLVWRMCDMVEKTLLDLKRQLADAHPALSCLQEAVEEEVAMNLDRELTLAAQEV